MTTRFSAFGNSVATPRTGRLTVLILAMVLAWLSGFSAQARTYFVWDQNDSTGVMSLRSAIIDANRRGGQNTIFLLGTNYHVSIAGAGENSCQTGDLDIRKGSLIITTFWPGVTATINAESLEDRVFHVLSGARLILSRVVIYGARGAYASEDPFVTGGKGGGILNAGQLVMSDCAVIGNLSGTGGYYLGTDVPESGGPGGGIFNSGTMTLNHCVISGNVCAAGNVSGDGGGVYNEGTAVLNSCVIANNSAGPGGTHSIGDGRPGGNGGGISNPGKMILNRCTISGNISGPGGGGSLPGWSSPWSSGGPGGRSGNGAGIHNPGVLKLNLCTISGNTVGKGGDGGSGGFAGAGKGGSGGHGGGIHNEGTLELGSCTVAYNSAGSGGTAPASRTGPGSDGGAGGSGGGVFTTENSSVTLLNTLIALNTTGSGGAGGAGGGLLIIIFPLPPPPPPGVDGAQGVGLDLAGVFVSEEFNLIGAADGSYGLTNGLGNDLVGSGVAPIDPLLEPLLWNGGKTPTHALLAGSPAIDQGKRFTPRVDQRGSPRRDQALVPNATDGDGSDIGAFEY